MGNFGCFSFYATKNVTTAEGGMVIAKDPDDIARIKRLALHGLSQDAWNRYSDRGFKHYRVTECGFKYNMTDIHAAIGIHQLKRVEQNWKKRQRVWDYYQERLANLPITLPRRAADTDRHAYHLFPILIGPDAPLNRDQFIDGMTEHGVGVGVHYLSVPEHPYYQERFGWHAEDHPVARDIGRRTASIPLQPGLSDEDLDRIVTAIKTLLS
jgi:dTDP-4-amino-4,6-dideoxygalactose transaminase